MSTDNIKYCIAGAGGFGRETLLCLCDMLGLSSASLPESVVFMSDDESSSELMGVPIIHTSEFNPEKYKVTVAIGNPCARRDYVARLPQNTEFASIIHPSVTIHDSNHIGNGAIITAGVILTCNIRLGAHAHLNLNTTIGHDTQIGDYFTTAPGVNVSGACEFSEAVYLGTNAAIRQGISICDEVTIGMGGIVIKDIVEPGTYVGNPVKKLLNS